MSAVHSHSQARRILFLLTILVLALVALVAPGSTFAQGPDKNGPLLRQAEQIEAVGEKAPEPAEPPAMQLPGVALVEEIVEAPLLTPEGKGKLINGQYIVVLNDQAKQVPQVAQTLVSAQGGKLLMTYEHALRGFVARLSPAAVAALRKNPMVAYIEQDQIVTIADTQTNATWGLDRIDQRNRPLNGTYVYNQTGSGVHAYIIDTGIRQSHNEFSGRIGNGYDAVTSGGSANDCNGHGTHVAGTVGGTTYGVAKQVTLHPVRVLNCQGSGSNSGVIAGVNWVTQNHQDPAVANMSLGGGISTALDNAVNNSINAGVTYAIAAGNSNANACNSSPARVGAAITVGSTTSTDARSSFSNYGTCLDLFAPGSSITSAWHTSNSATNTISGTSMATPHVAGVAALYLQANPSASPTTVRNAIVNGATTGVVSNPGSGSPNRLLYSLISGGGTPPPPTPTPPPSGGNVLQNPGFESGPGVAWLESSSGGYTLVTTSRPRTGSYSAWEGGYNNAVEYVYQLATVPSNGTLRYYWRMETSESSSTPYDWMDVRLYNSAGSYITTLRRWDNGDTRNTWSQDTISLSAYAGQQVYIAFWTDTDGSLATSFFIDDVSLQ